MADKLEEYLKKHLQSENATKEAWNTPSNRVWKGVAPQIEAKKGFYVPWVFLYTGFALLVVGLFVGLLINSNNNSNSKNLTSSKSTLKIDQNNNAKSPQKEAALKTSPTSSESPETSAGLIGKDLQKSPERFDQKSTDQKNKTNSVDKAPQEDYVSSKNVTASVPLISSQNNSSPQKAMGNEEGEKSFTPVSTKNADDLKNSEVVSEYMHMTQFPKSKENSGVFTADASGSVDFLARSESIKSFDDRVPPSDLLYNRSNDGYLPVYPYYKKWALGIYYAPTLVAINMSDKINGLFNSNNVYRFNQAFGIELYYRIKTRWTAVGGVSAFGVQSWTESNAAFSYDSSTESTSGSMTTNTSSQTSPSPFGSISSEVEYAFPNDVIIPDGDPMVTVSDHIQKVQYIGISAGIQYTFLLRERLEFFGGLNGTFNQPISDNTSFQPQVFHEGHPMDIMDDKVMQKPDYRTSFWGAGIESGIKYKWLKDFEWSATVLFQSSITPLYQQENARTSYRAFWFKMGVRYTIR